MKKKSNEFSRLMNKAGQILALGGTEAFMLAQVIDLLLIVDQQSKQGLAGTISHYENLERRRDLGIAIRKEVSFDNWELNILPREEESTA